MFRKRGPIRPTDERREFDECSRRHLERVFWAVQGAEAATNTGATIEIKTRDSNILALPRDIDLEAMARADMDTDLTANTTMCATRVQNETREKCGVYGIQTGRVQTHDIRIIG